MEIPVVENPKRKKRRTYTARQKAAGFGGRRSMAKRKARRKTVKRRRRRNPALATYVVNPRKRRTYRRRPTAGRRITRRRRRNPGLGNITNMLNLRMAMSVAAGILTARIAPGLLQKVWAGAPVTGFGGHAVRMGSVVIAGMAIKMVTKSNQFAGGVVAGGIGYILYDMANEFILPKLGLSGYNGEYAKMSELEQIGMGVYQPTANMVTGDNGMGAYEPAYGQQVLSS